MKKHWKTLMLTAATAAVFSCGVSAFAVSDVHANVYLDPVFVEGREAYCWTPAGKQTDYLSYNGTTYIPIRTAGEWMGKNVVWDEASKTITLSGTTEKVYHDQTEYEADAQTLDKLRNEGMTVKLRDDIKVVVDGKTQDFKNAKGEAVYPINYNNMNYLPVRNIGELLGMTVKYLPKTDHSPSTIFLRTALTDAQVQEGLNYVKTLQELESYQSANLPTSLVAKFDARTNVVNQQGKPASKSMFQCFSSVWDQVTLDESKAFTQAALSSIQKMIDTPCPELAVLSVKHEEMVKAAQDALTAFQKVQDAIDAGKDATTIAQMLGKNTSGASSACSTVDYIGAAVNEMYTILSESYARQSA